MKRILQTVGMALAVVGAAFQVAFAQTDNPTPATIPFQATTLSLAAYGEVRVAPDMATITLGVRNEAPTAAQALQATAVQMNRVLSTLKQAGIVDRDIRTAQLNVNPRYAYVPNQPPRLTGYEAANQVVVTARDLKRLGQTVDAAVNAGATDVSSINFGLINPTAAEDAARLAAVRALQAKADLYAKAMGRPILRLVTLNEGASAGAPPPPIPMLQAARAAAETPVSPGEMRVRIDVAGVYELAR